MADLSKITLKEGDITQESVDAIVNPANTLLFLGSGVAGAIRAKGGACIQSECDAHGPIGLGEAFVTDAGDLAAKFVIHAVGMDSGGVATEESVRAAMRRTLLKASEYGCRDLAVPAIGSGAGGLRLQKSAEVLIGESLLYLESDTKLEEIRFVLFGEPAFRVFEMVHDATRVAAQMERLRRR